MNAFYKFLFLFFKKSLVLLKSQNDYANISTDLSVKS